MLQLFGSKDLDVPNSDIRSTPMNIQPQFETAREVIVIGKILADLVRTLELIESDIAGEEERAKISDRSHARHPMLAKSLIERRDNIKMTITTLEERQRKDLQQPWRSCRGCAWPDDLRPQGKQALRPERHQHLQAFR
jgi:hypothetical protein